MRRSFGGLVLLVSWVVAPPARAADVPEPPPRCLRPYEYGEQPVCTWDGTAWRRTVEGGDLMGADTGVPGWFGALFVLVLLVGIGMTAWRVSLARRVAIQSGMDPKQATELVLLEDDGLEAAYLAGGLRGGSTPAPAYAPERTAEDRLRELARLRDEGLITPEEYQARRTVVLDSL